jgi:dihydroorotate dehydrogenase (fumarate)
MIDLSTRYLGLTLPHPLMLGASPLVDDLDAVRRAEDFGAAAIVMHSLFEERIGIERREARARAASDESFAEVLYLRSHRAELALGPIEYLEQLRRIKDAVKIPVIGSLNGITSQGWLEYARLIDQAGADAIELNVYRVVTDPEESAESIERTSLDMLAQVKSRTSLPIALKLSPYYTALPNFVARLAGAHADGVVLFNRFYQPDIDLEELEVSHRLELSSSRELLLRIRWLAILSAQSELTFGVSGGVHSVEDVAKAVMAGADGVQLVSEVLQHGLHRFSELRSELSHWLESHGYHSVAQAHGRMNLANCPDPAVYERANYARVLSSWRPPES